MAIANPSYDILKDANCPSCGEDLSLVEWDVQWILNKSLISAGCECGYKEDIILSSLNLDKVNVLLKRFWASRPEYLPQYTWYDSDYVPPSNRLIENENKRETFEWCSYCFGKNSSLNMECVKCGAPL